MGLACGGLGKRVPSGVAVQVGFAPETSHRIDSPAQINSSLPYSRDSEQALVQLGMILKGTSASDRALKLHQNLVSPWGSPWGQLTWLPVSLSEGIITAKLFAYIGQCDVGIGSGEDGGARQRWTDKGA